MTTTSDNEYQLPRVALIVAMTRQGLIGANGTLPWHLPEDMQLFKRLTVSNTVIMGRKTYDSIGRPLPDRNIIVLSKTLSPLPGIQVSTTFIDALITASRHGRPIFIAGGAKIYEQALPIASDLHISWVEGDYHGDIYFPKIDPEEWLTVEEKIFPGFLYVHYKR